MASSDWAYPFSQSTDPNVDLSSQDAFNEGAPYRTFERLRSEDPIAWTEESGGRGFWSITRHEDVLHLNRDYKKLSSAKGIRIEDQSEDEYEARKTFQETDPPEHTYFRMLLNEAFSRKSVANFEQRIREITSDLIDNALQQGELDATYEIARQLPMRMLAQILGVPDEDTGWLVEKGDALISNADPDYTDFVVDKVDTEEYRLLPFRSPAAMELYDYANGLARTHSCRRTGRRAEPHSRSRPERRLDHERTTSSGTSSAWLSPRATIRPVLALPPSLARFCQCSPGMLERSYGSMDDPVSCGTATWMRLIRWASPTSHFRRTATRDFEYGGKTDQGKATRSSCGSCRRIAIARCSTSPTEIIFPASRIGTCRSGRVARTFAWACSWRSSKLKVVLRGDGGKRVASVEQTAPQSASCAQTSCTESRNCRVRSDREVTKWRRNPVQSPAYTNGTTESEGYQRVRVLFADQLNLARGKYVPKASFAAKGSARLCLGAYAVTYQRKDLVDGAGSRRVLEGLPDIEMIFDPDASAPRLGAWTRRLQLPIVDLYEGKTAELCAGAVRAQDARSEAWRELGFDPMIGLEGEAYIFQRGEQRGLGPVRHARLICLRHRVRLSTPKDWSKTSGRRPGKCGFPIESINAEYDSPQFELTL